MTSKERVRAALSFQKPDRIPAAYEAVWSVNERLMKHYGYPSMEEIYQRFDIDIIPAGPRYIGPPDISWTDEKGRQFHKNNWGATYQVVTTAIDTYWDQVGFPLEGVETIEQLDQYKFPTTNMYDYSAIAETARQHPDKAIIIGHEGPFQHMCELMKMDELMMLMIDEPDVAKAMFNRMVDFEMEHYQRCFDAAPGQIDILRTHDDYGTQISLLFGLDMWKEFFMENTRRLVELAHRSGAFFQQHSCGAVEPIIPYLIECGVDSLEPVQKVRGMDADELMHKYGGRIAFHGGIDTQSILPYGTAEDVRRETERFIRTMGKNGGYILMASQGFEGDVPFENIEAMYSVKRD